MKIKLTENRYLGHNEKPYIIAEIGSNHNGDMQLAKQLIEAAKESGADCVKFQSWSKESIFSKKTYNDNYFLSDDYRNRQDYTLEEIVDKYAITEDELLEMKAYADNIGIDCTSTPFSEKEVDFLVDILKVTFIKVASMDLNHYPLLSYIAKKRKPILISTGLSNLSEIDNAVRTIEEEDNHQIGILHCVSVYPPDDKQINLKNIDTLAKLYPYPIGFSDHTIGTTIPIAAIARGACIIEKHFTLDKHMEGWDHKVSANPEEMKRLVKGVERVFYALGTYRITCIEPPERLIAFRRSIVAARNIKNGEMFTLDMLDYKRPGTGLSPEKIESIIGKPSKRNIDFDEIIKFDDF